METKPIATTTSVRRQRREVMQLLLDDAGKGSFADDAHQDGDERDADLDGGQEAVRILCEGEGATCPRITSFCTDGKPRLARRNDRKLGHCEKAVQHDQRENGEGLPHGPILVDAGASL
jgi:hypothetical protein